MGYFGWRRNALRREITFGGGVMPSEERLLSEDRLLLEKRLTSELYGNTNLEG